MCNRLHHHLPPMMTSPWSRWKTGSLFLYGSYRRYAKIPLYGRGSLSLMTTFYWRPLKRWTDFIFSSFLSLSPPLQLDANTSFQSHDVKRIPFQGNRRLLARFQPEREWSLHLQRPRRISYYRKCLRTWKRSTLASNLAMVAPKHCLAPKPNGRKVPALTVPLFSGLNRSGSKVFGLGKCS